MAVVTTISENVIRDFIKNDGYVFQLSGKRELDMLELPDNCWRVLVEVDGVRNVAQMSKESGVSVKDVRKALFILSQENLVEVLSAEVENFIEETNIEHLEKEFTKILGPVAGIILEDVLNDMEMTRSTIKKEQIYSFVESVSGEIDDENKKLEFQKISLEFLQKVMS